MLQHPTLDQLRHLKLHGMARAFAELNDNPQAGELDHGQWLALLLDREEAERDDRRLTYRLRNARLRHPEACIEDVDYRASRRLDKALFQQLARGKWIAGKQNLIVTGPCGVGKSWLACALGQKACRDDFSASTSAFPGCSPSSKQGAPTDATPACSVLSPRPSPHPRRLGTRPPQRRSATRPHGNRRGPIPKRRHPDHQPTARRQMARRHRRTYIRRRHPRPYRPQRAQDQGLDGPSMRKTIAENFTWFSTPTTLTTPNENDIKGAPNGDDHDAKFDPRPKWPFWIGLNRNLPAGSAYRTNIPHHLRPPRTSDLD